MWDDSDVTELIHIGGMTRAYVTWRMRDMTHSYLSHESWLRDILVTYSHDSWLMTHPYMYMSRDSLVLLHMQRAKCSYLLATARRLFKLLRLLLCQNKVLFQKRPSKLGVMTRRLVTEEAQRLGPVWAHSYGGKTHSYAHIKYFTNPTNSKSKCDVTRWCIYILRRSIHMHT